MEKRDAMRYEEITEDLKAMGNIKTKDIDQYNKKLIRSKADVSDLRDHVLEDSLAHRTYFQVSLGQLKRAEEQFAFIEENADLLQDWWHVDQLIQFVRRPVDFQFAFEKAKQYIQSELPFLRRWGYVLFLAGLQKDPTHTGDILSLIKNDDAYYVQMAEAWLIADLAVFNMAEVTAYMEKTDISYSIAGKAIQKMCDSFRITDADKAYMRTLRNRWKGE